MNDIMNQEILDMMLTIVIFFMDTCCLSPWNVAVCFPELSNTNTSSPWRRVLWICDHYDVDDGDDGNDDDDDEGDNGDDDDDEDDDDKNLWVGLPESDNPTGGE